MKNEYKDKISLLSSNTRKLGSELIDKLIQLTETTPTGNPFILETADYRSDGYNEKSMVEKFEEWGILTVEADDEYGHPIVLPSLEKLNKVKDALIQYSEEEIIKKQESQQALRPTSGINESTLKVLNSSSDWSQEELYEDEINLVKKLLQICNEITQSVVLKYPSYLAESDPDSAGFNHLSSVRNLHKNYSVFPKFSKSLPDKLPSSLVIKAQISFPNLRSRAESLHDEIESWKGKVYGIEQQKKFIFNRLMDYIQKSPHQNNEPYEYSERILGTYTPVNDNYPLGMSLSRPDPNRVDIKFQFMRVMRELEKDGHIEILGVDFDFDAQPRSTSASAEASKWSLGERSLEFYPARHCHVKLRPKPVNKVTNMSTIPLPKDVDWQKHEYKWMLNLKDGKNLEFLNPEKPTAIYFDLLINNHGNEIKHKKVMEVIKNITKDQIENLVKALRKKINNAGLSKRIEFTTDYEGGYTLRISDK